MDRRDWQKSPLQRSYCVQSCHPRKLYVSKKCRGFGGLLRRQMGLGSFAILRLAVCDYGHAKHSGILFRDVPRRLKPDSRDAVIQEAKEVVDQRIRENALGSERLSSADREANAM